MDPIAAALGRQRLVLDGGLATELERRGNDLSGAMWSARLLAEAPEAIEAAHDAFFAAGADVATSASYQATFEGFAAVGVDAADAEMLLRRSVALARRAADKVTDRPTWVAGSIGPYGAMLADGSEYRGDYGRTLEQLRQFHRRRLNTVVESGVDVLALETIPCAVEAEALLLEVAELGFPAWLSLSLMGNTTCSGDSPADVYAMAANVPEIIAVGANCSAPDDVTAIVSVAHRASGLPVVVYPNSGEVWNAATRSWAGAASFGRTMVQRWIADGAGLVGGCCRVFAEQVIDIADVVRPPTSSNP